MAGDASRRNGVKGGRPKGTVSANTLLRQRTRAAIAQRLVDQEELTAARLLEEWRRLALVNLRDYFDEDNNLKPISELTVDQGAALASIEVVIKNAQAGDGHTDTVHKFKLWDKVRVLESAAKYLGLLKEQVVHSGQIELVARLQAGRQRITSGPD